MHPNSSSNPQASSAEMTIIRRHSVRPKTQSLQSLLNTMMSFQDGGFNEAQIKTQLLANNPDENQTEDMKALPLIEVAKRLYPSPTVQDSADYHYLWCMLQATVLMPLLHSYDDSIELARQIESYWSDRYQLNPSYEIILPENHRWFHRLLCLVRFPRQFLVSVYKYDSDGGLQQSIETLLQTKLQNPQMDKDFLLAARLSKLITESSLEDKAFFGDRAIARAQTFYNLFLCPPNSANTYITKDNFKNSPFWQEFNIHLIASHYSIQAINSNTPIFFKLFNSSYIEKLNHTACFYAGRMIDSVNALPAPMLRTFLNVAINFIYRTVDPETQHTYQTFLLKFCEEHVLPKLQTDIEKDPIYLQIASQLAQFFSLATLYAKQRVSKCSQQSEIEALRKHCGKIYTFHKKMKNMSLPDVTYFPQQVLDRETQEEQNKYGEFPDFMTVNERIDFIEQMLSERISPSLSSYDLKKVSWFLTKHRNLFLEMLKNPRFAASKDALIALRTDVDDEKSSDPFQQHAWILNLGIAAVFLNSQFEHPPAALTEFVETWRSFLVARMEICLARIKDAPLNVLNLATIASVIDSLSKKYQSFITDLSTKQRADEEYKLDNDLTEEDRSLRTFVLQDEILSPLYIPDDTFLQCLDRNIVKKMDHLVLGIALQSPAELPRADERSDSFKFAVRQAVTLAIETLDKIYRVDDGPLTTDFIQNPLTKFVLRECENLVDDPYIQLTRRFQGFILESILAGASLSPRLMTYATVSAIYARYFYSYTPNHFYHTALKFIQRNCESQHSSDDLKQVEMIFEHAASFSIAGVFRTVLRNESTEHPAVSTTVSRLGLFTPAAITVTSTSTDKLPSEDPKNSTPEPY